MTLEAKKLSIIKQVLALEEESVLDAVLKTITDTFSRTSNDSNVIQEEAVVYEIKQASSIDKYVTHIEPKLNLEKIKQEQGFVNVDREKIDALITEADIKEPIELLLADLD